ncbi:MAG: DUF1844 domain-containing protein [Myxococcota bacterium]
MSASDSTPDKHASAGVNSPLADDEAPHALPPMDFSMFVMSLGSSAMVNLGQVPPPDSDSVHIDLPAAKQIIDILGILEDKTRGNLDESEQKLLSGLLYELRVHYVDAQNQQK